MTHPTFTLISHHLCPYVQRAAIALLEKDVPFERINIDLRNKPDWFLELSPLGKVPVLVVDEHTVLFESSVIAQYVDEVTDGELLSDDPLQKARQRGWMEYASSVIANVGRLYNAADEESFNSTQAELAANWQAVEANLSTGPWFDGEEFSLVDAAFAPVFRYFDVIEPLTGIEFFRSVPKVNEWRQSLSERGSVQAAVGTDFHERLLKLFADRNSVIGRLAADTQRVVQRVA